MSNCKTLAVNSTSDARQSSPEDLLFPHDRPFVPCLRSDRLIQPPPQSLAEYHQIEGRDNRKRRLRQIWQSLPDILKQSPIPHDASFENGDGRHMPFEKLESFKAMYDRELLLLCKIPAVGSQELHIGWREFKEYAEAKEAELWHIFHDELDLDGNGHLDPKELHSALSKAGIELSPSTASDFIMSLSAEPHSSQISFGDFRDFFILLPRRVSPAEIYQYYEIKKYLDSGCGPARIKVEGDDSLSAENKPPDSSPFRAAAKQPPVSNGPNDLTHGEGEEEDESHHFLEGHTALKFLLAGGVAGAVSRTCTAPLDRLKIFLITRPPELGGPSSLAAAGAQVTGVKTIMNAVTRIYSEGGFLAFWTGNGLSVAKIFPESAIKFFAYESSKRAFAKYWDKVEDSRDISGISRFLSGGLGGLSSQLSIYPIETLKTQMMSSTGLQRRTLVAAARHLWAIGGIHAYYRGLSIGLVGVFPYSAIDMSTFEALKLAYQRSTGTREPPGVLALLAFGSISGSVGATSVYPLNLVRTRLQASGSSGHPQIYTGVLDVAAKTWEREGWKGFYRGLFPTLAKVVPAVSISYVVYEHAKRRLGV